MILKKTRAVNNLPKVALSSNPGNSAQRTRDVTYRAGLRTKKSAPPVPQLFKITEGEGGKPCCHLDLGTLADLAFDQLDLRFDIRISRAGCIFEGSKGDLQSILNFANLFASVRDSMPSDVLDSETDLGKICAHLAMSSVLKLSDDNIVSGPSRLVNLMAPDLRRLSEKYPATAFALFSRCSARIQVAILDNPEGKKFMHEIKGNADLEGRCAKMLAAAAGRAAKRYDSQMLKRILTVCPLFARALVLARIVRHSDKIEQLCTQDDDLAKVLKGALPSPLPSNLPSSAEAGLSLRLTCLPQPPSSGPDGKQLREIDLGRKKEIYDRLKDGGWLTESRSGELRLDNVPTLQDLPVADVIELMTMESPATAVQLALDLVAGFAGPVRRSSPAAWTTPHAIQAWCALQERVDELGAHPAVALAKHVCDKFQKRLAMAWAELDPNVDTASFSALLAVLDGRELATWRELLSESKKLSIDRMLSQWCSDRLAAALNAGSGQAARAAMRRCGVLGVALSGGAQPMRKAENFFKEMLVSVISDQSNRAQDADMLSAFLAMLEEANPQAFWKLATANVEAKSAESVGYLIVQTDPSLVVEGPRAPAIRQLMVTRWAEAYSPAVVSQNPYVAALQKQEPVVNLTDYQNFLLRTTVPDSPAQGVWVAELLDGVASLEQVNANPAKSQEAAKYLRQIASALATAPPNNLHLSEVKNVLTGYLDALVKANDWSALRACCKTFGLGTGASTNGQIILAELLGGLASTAWANNPQSKQSENILASFLNNGPFLPNVMAQFTQNSQSLLKSLTSVLLWRATQPLLDHPAGMQARHEWANAMWTLVQQDTTYTDLKGKARLERLAKLQVGGKI